MGASQRGSAARGLGGGSVYIRPSWTQKGSAAAGGAPLPTPPLVPAPGPCPLPLGDRRPSKKHAGTRPLKEPPHGKSSGRRTWRRERVPFLCLLPLSPVAGRAGSRWPHAASGVSGYDSATERRTGGTRRQRGWVHWPKAPARSGEHKLLSLQVQEVSSQVLTHNNCEQWRERAAGKGREKGKAGAAVVLRNQRPRDAWPRAGPAPGLGRREQGAPR